MKNEEMIGKKFGKLTILETFKDQKQGIQCVFAVVNAVKKVLLENLIFYLGKHHLAVTK